MKLIKVSALAFLAAGMVACGGSDRSDEIQNELNNMLDEMDEQLETAGAYMKIDTDPYFEMEIPSNMVYMPELNEEASLTYGYTAQAGSEVKEHYVIVITETKDEIEQIRKEMEASELDVDMEFDALSYSEISVASITASLSSFEILSGEPAVVQKNGMDCVITEVLGKMGEVGIYYKLGVFEGEKAFYQVLSWTIDNQRDEFMEEMDYMLDNFKEKK